MMAIFMAAIESSIVATAMPTIVAELGGFHLFSWAFAAYLLTQAVTIPIYGRLADLYGRKRVFFAGASLFLVGSTLCGLAWGMVPLILFRGTARGRRRRDPADRDDDRRRHLQPDRARPDTGLHLGRLGCRRSHRPDARRLPCRARQLVARVLDQSADRRRDVRDVRPLPARTPAAATASDRLSRLGSDGARRRRLMLALVQVGNSGEMATIAALAAGGAVALIALAAHERSAPEPMLPLKLWRNRVVAVGCLGGFAVGVLMMSLTAFLPTYVQGAMGRSPAAAGSRSRRPRSAGPLPAIAAGRLMIRTSYRLAAGIGGVCLVAGSLVLMTLDPSDSLLWAGTGALLIGIGMGFCNTAFIVSTQASVGWNERGMATSSIMFMRMVGTSVGAAVFGAIVNFGIHRQLPEAGDAVNRLMQPAARQASAPDEIARLTEAIASSVHVVYVVAGLVAVVSLLLALALPARLSPTRPAALATESSGGRQPPSSARRKS